MTNGGIAISNSALELFSRTLHKLFPSKTIVGTLSGSILHSAVFTSVEDLDARLRQASYVVETANLEAIYGTLAGNSAILVEGPPGTGKTELARGLTIAAGTTMERLQCYEGIGEDEALGRFDRPLQDQYLALHARRFDRKDWNGLRETIYSLDFFSPGPLVRALVSETPCVLLIDEIDKTSPAFEAMTFQFLEEWRVTIPKLGTIEARSQPMVVLTSNNQRELSDPLRSRCTYLHFEYPKIQRELEILRLRLANQTTAFYAQIGGLAKALRTYRLSKPPSIREILKLAQLLDRRGCAEITPDMRDVLLPFLVKTQDDRNYMLLNNSFRRLCADANRHAAEILQQEEEGRGHEKLSPTFVF